MKSRITAKFGFLPRGSQQLVVLFGLIALIGAIATIVFDYAGKSIAVPAIIAVIATILAVVGWLLSRGTADFDGSLPVTLADSLTGRTIAADPRLLSNPKTLRLLSDAVSTMLDRRPLPAPDGMVRADGTPDVSRAADAKAVVNGINQQTQQNTNGAIDSLAYAVNRHAVAQPTQITPPDNVVLGANVASSGQ